MFDYAIKVLKLEIFLLKGLGIEYQEDIPELEKAIKVLEKVGK